MGQLVTFQCPECCSYWVLEGETLAPITVYRARAEESDDASKPAADRRIYLPFWVAEVDAAELAAKIAGAVDDLRSAAQAVIRAGYEGESARKLPASSEIEHLEGRLRSLGTLRIYVPAFKSLNTYAYLKVGRLLTRIQPSFEVDRSDGAGHAILCALKAGEAAAIMDFIFIATLPESIQASGDFLEKIRLVPARPPRLVEFPFRERGASLVSVIGGFWISGRLVEGVESLVE